MGSKSQVRSMQRGAQKRDREPKDSTPDYANFSPYMTKGEELHFGVAGEQRDRFLKNIEKEIDQLVSSGIGKPSQICQHLNRFKKRTFLGETWSPRLCHFLKKELAALSARERQERQRVSPARPKVIEGCERLDGRNPIRKLEKPEMERRLRALQDYYNGRNK